MVYLHSNDDGFSLEAIPKHVQLTSDGQDSWHELFANNYVNAGLYHFPVLSDDTTMGVTGVSIVTGKWIVSWCDGAFKCSIDASECVPVIWDQQKADWVPE